MYKINLHGLNLKLFKVGSNGVQVMVMYEVGSHGVNVRTMYEVGSHGVEETGLLGLICPLVTSSLASHITYLLDFFFNFFTK